MRIINDPLNTKPADRRTKREVERRLLKSTPAATLLWDSVKRCSIPRTHYEATLFIYSLPIPKAKWWGSQRQELVLVIEFCQPDLPHIYRAYKVDRNPNKNLQAMIVGLASLSRTIQKDKRFRRGNIIQLNGAPR